MRWSLPRYSEIPQDVPAHSQQFQFKVVVNDVEYIPSCKSPTKKKAKIDAANEVLQQLGLLKKTESYEKSVGECPACTTSCSGIVTCSEYVKLDAKERLKLIE